MQPWNKPDTAYRSITCNATKMELRKDNSVVTLDRLDSQLDMRKGS